MVPVKKQKIISSNNGRLLVRAVILFLLLLSTVGCCFIKRTCALTQKSASPYDIYDQTAAIIEKNCVDQVGKPIKLDTSARPDVASLMSQLDSSAELFTRSEAEIIRNPLAASIGIAFRKKEDICRVIGLYKGSPASRAGIRVNDKIIEINGEPVEKLKLMKVRLKLFGAPGTEIALKIVSADNEMRVVKLIREIIDIESLVDARLISDKIGYIQTIYFNHKTLKRLKSAVKKLIKDGMEGLILDLRGNVGGLFSSVTEASQFFLKRGLPMIQVFGKSSDQNKTYNSYGWSHYVDFPMVILIDRNTSSGAELLSVALKENGRAVLIGEKTAGEISLYTAFPLNDGSLLSLRTHIMLTPNGEPMNNGVEPDIEIKVSDEDVDFIHCKMNRIYSVDDHKNFADIQLDAAIAHLTKQIKEKK